MSHIAKPCPYLWDAVLPPALAIALGGARFAQLSAYRNGVTLSVRLALVLIAKP